MIEFLLGLILVAFALVALVVIGLTKIFFSKRFWKFVAAVLVIIVAIGLATWLIGLIF